MPPTASDVQCLSHNKECNTRRNMWHDSRLLTGLRTKVKVGVLRPVQQPGSYWDRSSELPLVGLEPTEVTAYVQVSEIPTKFNKPVKK